MAPDPIIRGFILAAGFGSRLAPITEHLPKPLLTVGGATLLDHAVAALDRAGIKNIAVNSHHLGSLVENHVVGRSDASRFQLFPEKEIQGTGGALHGARTFLEEADYFVVFNGDVLCDVDLSALIGVHIENQALATLLLVDRPNINTVHLNADQSIIHIEGAGPLEEAPAEGNGLTYTGIGVFSRRILEDIGPGFSSLIAPLVRAMAIKSDCVKGLAPSGIFWDDLGTLPRLLHAAQDIDDDPARYSWLQNTPNLVSPPMHMTRITGHGSDRHFWRLATVGWAAIAMQSPADDEEFTRQLSIGKFLHDKELGSAQVFSADEAAKVLLDQSFTLIATRGTADWLTGQGLACDVVNKVYEGRPDITDMMKDGDVHLVMNTTEGAQAVEDSKSIRSIALYDKIPYFTTAAGSHAAALAIKAQAEDEIGVKSLQG